MVIRFGVKMLEKHPCGRSFLTPNIATGKSLPQAHDNRMPNNGYGSRHKILIYTTCDQEVTE